MDLKELYDIRAQRHPWEKARLKAIQRILNDCAFEGIRVLDVGCGDGFVARGLFNHLEEKSITAVDIFLTDELIREIERVPGGVQYSNELPESGAFDLVLLLDVLEHMEDARGFLVDVVDRQLSKGGRLLITAPAFQFLHGRHDQFLGHYRRYGLQQLVALAKGGGLEVVSSGYLFMTLLLPKYFLYKLSNAGKEAEGVGRWHQGRVVTRIIEGMLDMDNRLLMATGRLGLKMPGLTGWVLCEKPD